MYKVSIETIDSDRAQNPNLQLAVRVLSFNFIKENQHVFLFLNQIQVAGLLMKNNPERDFVPVSVLLIRYKDKASHQAHLRSGYLLLIAHVKNEQHFVHFSD